MPPNAALKPNGNHRPAPALKAENLLLSRLRDEDWERIAPHLKTHVLQVGDVLQKAGDEVTLTWFPCGAASAGFQVWSDAESPAVDVVTIGQEGAVGGIVSHGNIAAYATAAVRSAGTFLAIRTAHLEKTKEDSVALRHWFTRYADCLVAQLFQNAACNASHTIRQRAARWLLTMAARTHSLELPMTHEQLSDLLGVGRSFVTRTIKDLREEGLLQTRRGVIILTDCEGLRKVSCDCSDYIAAHYETVLAGLYPAAPSEDCDD